MERPDPMPAARKATKDDSRTFDEYLLDKAKLKFFAPSEFLIRGTAHGTPGSPGYGLNTDPPRELWKNIVPTAKLLDQLRERLDTPIRIISAYRSPEYNRAIAGAHASMHIEFRAVDFICSWALPDKWVQELLAMRHEKIFKGGIGRYGSFVHVDTRGWNADW
jgi:hypothetical protein